MLLLNINKYFLPLLFLFALFSPVLGVKFGFTIKMWMLCAPFLIFMSNYKPPLRRDVSVFLLVYFFSASFSLILNLADTSLNSIVFLAGLGLLFIVYLSFETINYREFRTVFVAFVKIYVGVTLIYYSLGVLYFMLNETLNNRLYFGIFIQSSMPRLSGLVGDPNLAALYFAIIFVFCLLYRCKVLAFLCIFIILLTVSRTAFIFLVLTGIVLSFRTIKKSVITVVAIFCLALFCFVLLHYIDLTFDSNMNVRALNVENISQAGGRMELWVEVMKHIAENPYSVSGFGNSRAFSELKIGTATYFHNTFLELVYELGLMQTLVLVSFVIFFVMKSQIERTIKLIYLSCLLCFGLSLSLTLNEVFFFSLFALSSDNMLDPINLNKTNN